MRRSVALVAGLSGVLLLVAPVLGTRARAADVTCPSAPAGTVVSTIAATQQQLDVSTPGPLPVDAAALTAAALRCTSDLDAVPAEPPAAEPIVEAPTVPAFEDVLPAAGPATVAQPVAAPAAAPRQVAETTTTTTAPPPAGDEPLPDEAAADEAPADEGFHYPAVFLLPLALLALVGGAGWALTADPSSERP